MKCIAVVASLLGLSFASQIPLDSAIFSAPEDAVDFTTYQHHATSHKLRIKRQNDTICDARSPQYTGWLDIGKKHLFFWYFESQQDPKQDPLTLWLTGGPGGSGMGALINENGPCLINKHGNGTVHNPYGWSAITNLLFIDQPAGVGFSYVDDGEPLPGDSFTAAQDMHAFLQIFTHQAFPHLSKSPFHITGESYAGHYVPALGAEIVSQNALRPSSPQINLSSIFVGNAYVSPLDITFGFWETLCTRHPGLAEPIFNSTRCDVIAANLPRCIEVGKTCYAHPDPAICAAAQEVCWEGVAHLFYDEVGAGGRNPFDITRRCYGDDELCYSAFTRIEKYLNRPEIWKALGVPAAVKKYRCISEAVYMAFQATNDEGISMQPQVQYLLASGIDVMFYQGNYDLACNTAGNLRWANSMPWSGQAEFASKMLRPWQSRAVDGRPRTVGSFKGVEKLMLPGSKKRTRFGFVTVEKAGHMVPADQPEVALDMVAGWLDGAGFASDEDSLWYHK